MKPILISAAVVLIAAVVFVGLLASRVMGQDVVKDPAAPAAPGAAAAPATQPGAAGKGPLDFVMKDIDGNDYDLARLKGKVVLFVNVASKCGFTPQYEGLEKLYKTYKDRGFVIVGFPANNFGHQEPGTNEQIKQFCTSKYDVTFPMMAKISVKGDDQHPLYKYLTDPATDGDFAGPIGWNFTKFLIDRSGHVYARFASKTKPSDPTVTQAIEKGLGE
jgi:glutathione peroxidase